MRRPRVLSARWAPASGVAWYADEQDEVELFAALVLCKPTLRLSHGKTASTTFEHPLPRFQPTSGAR
jgi:hypothetical protein